MHGKQGPLSVFRGTEPKEFNIMGKFWVFSRGTDGYHLLAEHGWFTPHRTVNLAHFLSPHFYFSLHLLSLTPTPQSPPTLPSQIPGRKTKPKCRHPKERPKRNSSTWTKAVVWPTAPVSPLHPLPRPEHRCSSSTVSLQ